jgi:hypothetical protein
MNTNIRVYYKVALYPEDTFDPENWEDDYDFVKDREDNFNLHLVTDDKAPFVTKNFIECCNWNKEDDEYITKISYYGNGLFIAELYFSYLHLDDIRDIYYETEIKDNIISQLFPDKNASINTSTNAVNNYDYININDTYYELDIEIESIYKINSKGKELELLFTSNEELNQHNDEDDDEDDEEDDDEEKEELNKEEKEKEKYNDKKLLKNQINVYKKPNSNIIHTEMELEDYDD